MLACVHAGGRGVTIPKALAHTDQSNKSTVHFSTQFSTYAMLQPSPSAGRLRLRL